MPQLTLFPMNDQHIWFNISMGRKSPRFTNFNKLHSHIIHEERTTPVLQASVTNHCAAHTRSTNGLRWKMEGHTCLQKCVVISTSIVINNANIIHKEIS